MAANEVNSNVDWFLADIKQRVELYGEARIDYDGILLDFFSSIEDLEGRLRKHRLATVFDDVTHKGIVWEIGQEPVEGWPKAKVDKLVPRPI